MSTYHQCPKYSEFVASAKCYSEQLIRAEHIIRQGNDFLNNRVFSGGMLDEILYGAQMDVGFDYGSENHILRSSYEELLAQFAAYDVAITQSDVL